jgi:8-oxo-dGTP diphosphatase
MSDLPRGPALTTDCVCFDSGGRVLLIRRKYPPYQDAYALPGGFVEIGETVEQACRRELAEETGLVAGALGMIGVYSAPGRDPRGHTVTIAFMTEIAAAQPSSGSDAASAEWISDWANLELAFDHAEILRAACAARAGT